MMKFAPGDLVKNVTTNEDGRVIEAYEENGAAMHMVSVPVDGASWMFGARVAYWPDDELESSKNETLDQGLCA
jgi:hypothetical protein